LVNFAGVFIRLGFVYEISSLAKSGFQNRLGCRVYRDMISSAKVFVNFISALWSSFFGKDFGMWFLAVVEPVETFLRKIKVRAIILLVLWRWFWFSIGESCTKASQQSVHLTLGILRKSQAVFYALSFSQLDGFAVPAPAQVTQTVGWLRRKTKSVKYCHVLYLKYERNTCPNQKSRPCRTLRLQ
jgi:hypothetical protein